MAHVTEHVILDGKPICLEQHLIDKEYNTTNMKNKNIILALKAVYFYTNNTSAFY